MRDPEDTLAQIREILYPDGDREHQWTVETIEYVAAAIDRYDDPDRPHEQFPCHCEHSAHAPDKWCHNSSEFGAVSDYVGNVCPACARDCLDGYIIWPVALHDGRMVYTVDADHLLMLRQANPDAYFATMPAWDNHVYVVATSEHVGKARPGWEAYKAERARLGL